MPQELVDKAEKFIDLVLQTGGLQTFEHDLTIDGEKRSFEYRLVPCGEGKVLSIVRNITERRKMERELRENEKRLAEQNYQLMEKNIALRELMSQIKQDKEATESKIANNVQNLLLPLISRMKADSPRIEKITYDLLENTVKNLLSTYGGRFSEKMHRLTPREIEICNFVRNGLTSKEIARLLSLASRSVETHRTNIRKKLGIKDRDINLASYLNSL